MKNREWRLVHCCTHADSGLPYLLVQVWRGRVILGQEQVEVYVAKKDWRNWFSKVRYVMLSAEEITKAVIKVECRIRGTLNPSVDSYWERLAHRLSTIQGQAK